jgi:hypothetical protein
MGPGGASTDGSVAGGPIGTGPPVGLSFTGSLSWISMFHSGL